MPPLMLVASLASTALGAGISAASSIAAGKNAEALGKYQQEQAQQEGYTAIARAQRRAEDQQRRTQLVQSSLTARAAGASMTPSVGTANVLTGQIGQRGAYAALMDLAQGKDIAAGYTNIGQAERYQGDLAESMAPLQAAGSLAGGAASMFSTAGRYFTAGGYG